MLTSNDPTVVVRNLKKTFVVNKSGSELTLSPYRRRVEALKGVSFVAERGESIGVLGRNGSGKSTLLNVIAGNEKPTSGDILVSSVPSLLSVSAALQSHLSGRQNVRLGLLAQGLPPKNVRALENEVGEWAQIGEALDRPLNTYSSGMKARLKFAISTANHPEILMVDEALATGDAAFAQRAKERMQTFLRNSGTVFIVSHSPGALKQHCNRAIWLHLGEVLADGSVEDVGEEYAKWSRYSAAGDSNSADLVLDEMRSNYESPEIVFDSEAIRKLDQRQHRF